MALPEAEQQLVDQLAELEQQFKDATKAVTLAKRQWVDAESDLVTAKLERDRAFERLRVYRNTTPRYEPSLDDLEIERFRQAYPDICEWARQRDDNQFIPPPHINAEVHKKLMDKLQNSSSEEIVKTAIKAGIYTEDGQLTEHYKPDDE